MLKRFIPAFFLLTYSMAFGTDLPSELKELRPSPVNRTSFKTDISYRPPSYRSHSNSSTTTTTPQKINANSSVFVMGKDIIPNVGWETTAKMRMKKKLNYTTLSRGEILLQREADAAMILNRFHPDFLRTMNDYNKLTCKEFCDHIITLYRNAVIGFYETVENGFEDINGVVYERVQDEKELKEIAQNLDCSLPSSVKNKITRSIKNYLDTITFS